MATTSVIDGNGATVVDLPKTHIQACIKVQEDEYAHALRDPLKIKDAISLSEIAVLSAKNRNPSPDEITLLDSNLERIRTLSDQYESKQNPPPG